MVQFKLLQLKYLQLEGQKPRVFPDMSNDLCKHIPDLLMVSIYKITQQQRTIPSYESAPSSPLPRRCSLARLLASLVGASDGKSEAGRHGGESGLAGWVA